MVEDIVSYLEYLESRCGLSVSVHTGAEGACPVVDSLTPYNIHRSDFCLSVKADFDRHRRCLAHQRQVRAACNNEMFCVRCPYGVQEQIVPIVREDCLLGYLAVSTDMDEKTVRTLLRPLAVMLSQVMEQESQTHDNDLYRHMLAVIHAGLDQKLTIEYIADRCYCSSSMVSHLFKERSGVTVNRYITARKMQKAEQLLRQGVPIAEAARSCGFDDTNYFISVFKKHFGQPPMRYLKNQYFLESTR